MRLKRLERLVEEIPRSRPRSRSLARSRSRSPRGCRRTPTNDSRFGPLGANARGPEPTVHTHRRARRRINDSATNRQFLYPIPWKTKSWLYNEFVMWTNLPNGMVGMIWWWYGWSSRHCGATPGNGMTPANESPLPGRRRKYCWWPRSGRRHLAVCSRKQRRMKHGLGRTYEIIVSRSYVNCGNWTSIYPINIRWIWWSATYRTTLLPAPCAWRRMMTPTRYVHLCTPSATCCREGG